ncbi:MAG: 30S ribosomal protein S20 [Gammaproteobacteria bacterium]|nr:30S ribosomal protein S20 [Gammaproteobacteria bacterium]NIR98058.1 30S ribosomal protein S20 [Gammaproteobacteria bacterium]NIT63768.1 30S ribosomal protein S20 [Gammaproteobacteria bacterium]NIV20718.1 30S ribosomal protein S20 [Gammaproteobacteria bacterium]NIY32348.1 30S ribosomal protein S20 [Gammaproteobacteria bacterium]
MANTRQARKRARQAEHRRRHNGGQRAAMRTYVKNVIKAIRAGDKAAAERAYKAAQPVIDSSACMGLIHKNKAARHKSRLSQRIRAMQ